MTTGPGRPLPLRAQDWPAGAEPVVSVFCPTYNHEAFIAECLDGILDQVTDFPVEVIVHDDASTDGTVAIVRDYARRYPALIQTILQEENRYSRGLKLRPLLLEQARGAFIASCDGDDRWLDPDKLAKQVGFLRDNPEFVLSYHEAMVVDADGRVIKESWRRANRDYSAAGLKLEGAGILTGTTVYRNVPLEFPPEYHLTPNGDAFVPLLLAAFGGAKFQGDVGKLAYRQHGGGKWSARSRGEKTQSGLQSLLQITAYFVRIGEQETAKAIMKRDLKKRIRRYLGQTRTTARLKRYFTGK